MGGAVGSSLFGQGESYEQRSTQVIEEVSRENIGVPRPCVGFIRRLRRARHLSLSLSLPLSGNIALLQQQFPRFPSCTPKEAACQGRITLSKNDPPRFSQSPQSSSRRKAFVQQENHNPPTNSRGTRATPCPRSAIPFFAGVRGIHTPHPERAFCSPGPWHWHGYSFPRNRERPLLQQASSFSSQAGQWHGLKHRHSKSALPEEHAAKTRAIRMSSHRQPKRD